MSPLGAIAYALQFLARLLSLTLTVALAASGLAKLISSTKVLPPLLILAPHAVP